MREQEFVRAALDEAQQRKDEYVSVVERLVNQDSNTLEADDTRACGQLLQQVFLEHHWEVEAVPGKNIDGVQYGDSIIATKRGTGKAKILFIGHYDTVYKHGSAQQHPFRIEGDYAYGPGTSDMKGGVVEAIIAADIIEKLDPNSYSEIIFISNPDEEVGSPSSKDTFKRVILQRKPDAAFEFEDGRPPKGTISIEGTDQRSQVITSRNGRAAYSMEITGVPTHAATHESVRGRSSILAAAKFITAFYDELGELKRRYPDITFNIAPIEGGSQPNIIAGKTRLQFEVRGANNESYQIVKDAAREIASRTYVDGTTVETKENSDDAPMERTPAIEHLYRIIQSLGQTAGVEIDEDHTAGGSDANRVAHLGVPVLAAMGPVGENEHSENDPGLERIYIPSAVIRAGLVAAAVREIGQRINEHGSLVDENERELAAIA